MYRKQGLMLGLLCLFSTAGLAQTNPRLTIKRQRVVQSCGAVLDAEHLPGAYQLSSIVGLSTLGTVRASLQSKMLFGFWVPLPVILSSERKPPDVVAGDRIWTWPNPFREDVQIEVQLLGSKAVEADIFDIVGQHIVTLPVLSLRDDVAAFRWNGASSSGALCASGVYTIRIHLTEPVRQRKILCTSTITRNR